MDEKLCACGCGQVVPPPTRKHLVNRYARGHGGGKIHCGIRLMTDEQVRAILEDLETWRARGVMGDLFQVKELLDVWPPTPPEKDRLRYIAKTVSSCKGRVIGGRHLVKRIPAVKQGSRVRWTIVKEGVR